MSKRFLTEIQAISGTFTQNISASATPTLSQHLVNKAYVDTVAPTEIDGGSPTTSGGGNVIDGGTF